MRKSRYGRGALLASCAAFAALAFTAAADAAAPSLAVCSVHAVAADGVTTTDCTTRIGPTRVKYTHAVCTHQLVRDGTAVQTNCSQETRIARDMSLTRDDGTDIRAQATAGLRVATTDSTTVVPLPGH